MSIETGSNGLATFVRSVGIRDAEGKDAGAAKVTIAVEYFGDHLASGVTAAQLANGLRLSLHDVYTVALAKPEGI